MAGQDFPFDLLNVENKNIQSPSCSHPGIFLTERTGRSVSGIFKGLFLIQLLTGTELIKTVVRHIYLAPNFQKRYRFFQLFGNRADGPDIGGDIFTGASVAPGGTAHQHPVPIFQ